MISSKTAVRRIGMFDSGVGGLTILRAITQALPQVPVIYFGDTARLPYGEKSPQTLLQFSRENIAFLLRHDVDLVIVGCHTASALALPTLEQEYQIPILGVIEAGIHEALSATCSGRIAVLGTRGTIQSEVYQRSFAVQRADAIVVPIACPLLVPLVEDGLSQHEASRLIVRDYLEPAKQAGVDTILLGCTHYPLLAPMIQAEMGDEVVIVDSAAACATQVKERFAVEPLLDTSPHRFFVSHNPEKFQTIGEQILGHTINASSYQA